MSGRGSHPDPRRPRQAAPPLRHPAAAGQLGPTPGSPRVPPLGVRRATSGVRRAPSGDAAPPRPRPPAPGMPGRPAYAAPLRAPRAAGLEFRPGIIPLRPLTLGDIYGAVTKAIRGNVAATMGLALITSLICLVPTTALGAWLASMETTDFMTGDGGELGPGRSYLPASAPSSPRSRSPGSSRTSSPGRARSQGGHRRDLGRHEAAAPGRRRGRPRDDRGGARRPRCRPGTAHRLARAGRRRGGTDPPPRPRGVRRRSPSTSTSGPGWRSSRP